MYMLFLYKQQLVVFISIIVSIESSSSGSCSISEDAVYEEMKKMTLEHCLNTDPEPVYTVRGTIVISYIREKSLVYKPEPEPLTKHAMPASGPPQYKAEALSYNLTTEEKQQLKALVKKNDIYRVRLRVKSTENPEEDYVLSYTQACFIYESSLNDRIWVFFGQSWEVIGFSISADPVGCVGKKVDDSNLTQWNTTVKISRTVHGPVPDTLSYDDKKIRDEEAKQNEKSLFYSKVSEILFILQNHSLDQLLEPLFLMTIALIFLR